MTHWRARRGGAAPLTAIALATFFLSCEPRNTERLNVILVLADTLRADHLGSYGYERPTSPWIDRFAKEAVLFEQNRSQGTCTFPSANSILTGRYPQQFARQEAGHLGIPAEIPTAATILKSLGRSTIAVSASPIVRKSPSYVNLVGGFEAGFDSFDEECLDRDASCVMERARALLSAAREPFFLYLHFMDPHAPYQAPSSSAPRFADAEYAGQPFVRAGDPQPIAAVLRAGQRPEVTDSDVAHLRDLYDEEVAYFDLAFGELVQHLRDTGRYDRTLLVLLSDHGEEFMEHERVVHCDRPFETLIRTPLILRAPGGPQGRRVAVPVGNLDVLPTILAYLAEDWTRRGLDGLDLTPFIEGKREPRYVFSSHAIWRGVTDGRSKLIWNLQANAATVFDLERDPGELSPIAGTSETATRLHGELTAWLQRSEVDDVPAAIERAEQVEQHLRASGYLD
jgi:arylsulfatase A-like enzyme